jgi:hypothetical protein
MDKKFEILVVASKTWENQGCPRQGSSIPVLVQSSIQRSGSPDGWSNQALIPILRLLPEVDFPVYAHGDRMFSKRLETY